MQVIIDIVPARVTNVRSNIPSTEQVHSVYHETGNRAPGANAVSERNYLHGGAGGRSVGYNFAVDDQRIIQLTPLDEVTWHAGKPWWNQCSWGIEQCVGAGLDLAKARSNAASLHGALCAAKGWDVDTAVVMHQVVYGKHCPAIILDNNLWPSVRAQTVAAAKASALAAKGTPPVTGTKLDLPAPLTLSVIKRLFGVAIGDDDRKYGFDPAGPVSTLWLANGKATGHYPELTAVMEYADGRWFRFSDGSVIFDPAGSAPPTYVGVAA